MPNKQPLDSMLRNHGDGLRAIQLLFRGTGLSTRSGYRTIRASVLQTQTTFLAVVFANEDPQFMQQRSIHRTATCESGRVIVSEAELCH